jgi:hypothetical protein
MTKLEEEIKKAIEDSGESAYNPAVKAAADIARKYIFEAYDAGLEYGEIKAVVANFDDLQINKHEWLEKNGII